MNNNPNVNTVPMDLCYEAICASQISLLIHPANPRRQNLRALTQFFSRLLGLDNVVTGRVVDHGCTQFRFLQMKPSNLCFVVVHGALANGWFLWSL